MTTRTEIAAELREKAGKGTARALRRESRTPAVIYGGNEAPMTITLDTHGLTLEYMKGNIFTTLFDVVVGGKKHLVLPRDVQLHPVADNVMHVDFLRVTPKTSLTVSVPVRFVNEDKCPGLERKGILNTVRHTVDLVCQAVNIPEHLDVDLAGKDYGDSIKLSDALMPAGSKPAVTDRDLTIGVINPPKSGAVVAAEEAAENNAEEGADAEGTAE